MRTVRLVAALGAAWFAFVGISDARAADNPWSEVPGPTIGPAASIGSPASGCFAGGVALPGEGEGWQVLRQDRHRNYGHPRTIAFIRQLAAKAKAERLGTLLIGDMAQARGGPMPSGHASHQTGLDVDIWFRLTDQALPIPEREAPLAISMVKGKGVDRGAWTSTHARLLKLAASAPEVDRIFVNPAIKLELCRTTVGDKGWLHKIRPWWGHDSHFHVRLSCPPGSSECQSQKEVPEGDGCGAEVASWIVKPTLPIPSDKPNHRHPILPATCTALLDQPAVIPAGGR